GYKCEKKKSALQPNPRRVFDSLRPVVLWFPLSSARPREKPTEKGDREKKANETKKTVASTALLGISGPWGSSIPCSLIDSPVVACLYSLEMDRRDTSGFVSGGCNDSETINTCFDS
ncbi:hypothetical protein MUK42_14673, partial [Musa troglodytarum]